MWDRDSLIVILSPEEQTLCNHGIIESAYKKLKRADIVCEVLTVYLYLDTHH